MPVIQVNNRSTHIQELNKEAPETVLMIHGMFSNLSIYYFSIAPILARHFHVVLYDLKSHGLSERTLNGYDLNSMTDDLRALMDTLNLTKVHLAGYSFGGLIALKMASRFPETVKKLAIVEAPDPSDDETRDIIDDYSRELLENYVSNAATVTQLKMGKRQLERNHQMYEFLFHQTSIKNDMLDEKDFFSRREIDRIPHETLLLYGSVSNCRDVGEKLQGKIKRSRFSLIDGDHNIPIQQPVSIGDTMSDFFQKLTFCAVFRTTRTSKGNQS